MSKQPPPAPTASAIGPCPTIIKIVGRPGTGSLPRTIAPPDHPYIINGLSENRVTSVTESNDTHILGSYINNKVTFKISMLVLGTKFSVKTLGVSNPCCTQSLG